MRLPWQRPKPDIEAMANERAMELVRTFISSIPQQGITTPATPKYDAYHYDFPYNFTVPQSPRRHVGAIVDVSTLWFLADTYDPLRSCIEHLKREVCTVPAQVQPKPGRPASDAQIEAAQEWLQQDGGLGGADVARSDFDKMLIEELLVIGAAALFTPLNRGKRIMEAICLDAATIRPVVDGFGWVDPNRAYEQWIQGLAVQQFSRDELIYRGLHPRAYTPYYASPIEWILRAIMAAIKADEWNLTWLTDGTTVADMISVPESWTPDQIQQFAKFFDAMHSGNTRERQKMKFVPSGSARVGSNGSKDKDFNEYELWLLRRTCSIMGVQPASIGYAGEQYKVSQDGSNSQTSAFGAGAILEFMDTVYTELLRRRGFENLQVRRIITQEEDPGKRSQRLTTAAGGPYLTINEAREEDGKEPIEGGDTVRQMDSGEQAEPEESPVPAPTEDDDLKRWERKALARVKSGKSASCEFRSSAISESTSKRVSAGLALATTAADVREAFKQ